MSVRQYFSSYSLARRVTFAAAATLLGMLLLAGLALAALFAKDQIEQSRVAALTQASVASSTASAALRFGGSDVIAESLRVFDSGPDPDLCMTGRAACLVNLLPTVNRNFLLRWPR